MICCIQAAALAHRHVREIALLTAAAAAFVLRYVPEVAIAIWLISTRDRHLAFDGNSLYELFLEIFPTVLVLAIVRLFLPFFFFDSVQVWPRKNVLASPQASVKGWLERILREKGLSVAVLCFFYFFMGFGRQHLSFSHLSLFSVSLQSL